MTKTTALRTELASVLKELRVLPYFTSYGRKKLLRRPTVENRLVMTPDNINLADLVGKALSAADIRDEDFASSAIDGPVQKTRVGREKKTLDIIKQFRVRTLFMPADASVEHDEPSTFLELMFSSKASDLEYLQKVKSYLEKYKIDTYTR